MRGDCQKASHSSPRWLSLGTGQQCIDFEQVLPDHMPINQMTTVQLTIRTLPELPTGANYKCVFGYAEPIDALMTGFGLSCPTPPVAERPSIPEGADHVLVPLAVRSSETNKDFVSRNFAFFDCSRHTVCTECVKSQWACSWCVYDNKCTHNTSCQGIISGENVSFLNLLHLYFSSIITYTVIINILFFLFSKTQLILPHMARSTVRDSCNAKSR